MSNVIEVDLHFGDGKTPNANGRIYPLDVIKQSVDKLNEGKTYVTNEITAFDSTIPLHKQVEAAGIVKSAKLIGNRVLVQIELTESHFGKVLPVALLAKLGKLVPTGTGDLEKVDGSDSYIVKDYNIEAVSFSANPAFPDIDDKEKGND